MKDKVKELKIETVVTEERLHPLLTRRNELTYGRLFLERSSSSFEVCPPKTMCGGCGGNQAGRSIKRPQGSAEHVEIVSSLPCAASLLVSEKEH